MTGVEGNGQVDKLVQLLQVKSDDDIFWCTWTLNLFMIIMSLF